MKNKTLLLIRMLSKYAMVGIFLQMIFYDLMLADNISAQGIQNVHDMKVEISIKEAPIKAFFAQIENKTDYKFAYHDADLDSDLALSYEKRESTVADVLIFLSKKSNLRFKQVNKNQYVDKIDKKNLKNNRIETFLQQNKVTGRVTDIENNVGLPGVNVLEKGTSNGTITDSNGEYALEVGANATLVFSYVGYANEEIAVGNRSTVNVSLTPDIASLQEIVVVGYGSMKKRDVTGAVSSISSKEISEIPATSAIENMQGRVAGVDIISTGNRPGADVNIRIRGNRSISAENDPLYVVDGIPFQGGINDINPNTVESIEVLKDASATAIYGSRGANGVILITTKRGKTGKARITYDAFYGIDRPDAENSVDVFSVDEFIEYRRDFARWDYNGNAGAWEEQNVSDEDIFQDWELDAMNSGEYWDWQEDFIRNGIRQDHQIGVSGGSETTNYYLSFNYHNERGINPKSGFDRFATQVNIDQKIGNRVDVGTSMLVTRKKQDWGISPYGPTLVMNPLATPFNEDGSINSDPDFQGHFNPYIPLHATRIDERISLRAFANFYGQVEIMDGLKYRINVGADYGDWRKGTFQDAIDGLGQTNGSLQESTEFNYIIENILRYQKTFNQHSLDITGLYSVQKDSNEKLSMASDNLPYSSRWHALESSSQISQYNTGLVERGLASYMGRLQYGFDSRYLLTLTGRADASSVLSEGNKWAFFPSVAAAWNVHNENFMNAESPLNELKFRVSHGVIGNQSVSPYESRGRLGQTTYVFGSNPALGYRPELIANPNLFWEKTTTTNIGIDFGLFDNRISGVVELYEQLTDDLLLNRSLPRTSGFGNITKNVGKTRNRGIELTLSGLPVDNSANNGLKWKVDLNYTRNKEEIIELFDKEDDIGNRWFIGQPISVFYDFEQEGVWQSDEVEEADKYNAIPGDIKIKDQNNDDNISGQDDRVIIGTPRPKWIGGMTNRFSYRNFELSIFAYARWGQTIESNVHKFYNRLNIFNNNLDVNYWTPDNPSNEYPRILDDKSIRNFSDVLTYYEGSYIKIRKATLAYEFPVSKLERLPFGRLRIYTTVLNPVQFTKDIDAVNLDMDVVGGNGKLEFEDDIPFFVRSYIIGVNLSF